MALTNSQSKEEIATILAEFTYDAEKIAEGKAIYDEAIAIWKKNKVEADEQSQAYADFNSLYEELDTAYVSLKKRAKIIFRKDAEVLKLCTFIELLVYIKKIFDDDKSFSEHPGIPAKLLPILEHIDNNLSNDLSLLKLSERFYINQSYLCRLFKKSIGSPLHEYIIIKRISNAKNLLLRDVSATEAAYESGFNDYSSFYRLFKRIVGTSPGKYKKAIL